MRATKASRVVTGPMLSSGVSVYEYFCGRFPNIAPESWLARFQRGLVYDAHRQSVGPTDKVTPHSAYFYFREVEKEIKIAAELGIIFQNEDLLVVDKPHFLPVTPSGPYLNETVLYRLDEPNLTPLHRLDRETAGLVMLSRKPSTRGLYQALFRHRQIHKTYHAIAEKSPEGFTRTVQLSLATGLHFLSIRVVEGKPNTETRLTQLTHNERHGLYQLEPLTGHKHQLRVHMNHLGLPILNDRLYPEVLPHDPEDYLKPPLQLLAKSLAFTDPITGESMRFLSPQNLVLSPD